jgi:hypothetical protein
LADNGGVEASEIVQQISRDGYAVLPRRLGDTVLATARAEIGAMLSGAAWGSGFDGFLTRKVWALLTRTRCMDQAALDPLVLDVVERLIGACTQSGMTYATEVHSGQEAQVLHYDQGIYPLPRDRDVMLTAMWALDDFTADNGPPW